MPPIRRMRVITGHCVDDLFVRSMTSFMEGIDLSNPAKPTFIDPIANRMTGDFSLREPDDPTSPDAGKLLLERSLVLQLEDPRNRLLHAKPVDPYNYAGLWWYLLSGRSDLDSIAFYNPIAVNFLDDTDPHNLRATWGERIFGSSIYYRPDRITALIELLRTNPSTRRAVLPVFTPDDIGIHSRNLPCLESIQFLTVNGRLDMISTMRSQAAYGVLPYDLFLLTMLHEWVALSLGAELGTYTHICPSFQIRESELPFVVAVAQTGIVGAEPLPMPPMQMGDMANTEELRAYLLREETLLRLEAEDRPIVTKESREQLTGPIPEYWRSLLKLTSMRRNYIEGSPGESENSSIAYTLQPTFPKDFTDKLFVTGRLDRPGQRPA